MRYICYRKEVKECDGAIVIPVFKVGNTYFGSGRHIPNARFINKRVRLRYTSDISYKFVTIEPKYYDIPDLF